MRSCLPGILILLLFLASSCRQKQSHEKPFEPSFSTYSSDSSATKASSQKNEIFYGILNPVEICAIFNRLGVPYDKSILNSVSNSKSYLSSSKAALNAGVYGVDFGYLKLFGVGQDVLNYVVKIRDLSNKLNIPDEYLTSMLSMIQKDIPDADTLLASMNKAFVKMENHLRESGRESTAGLMLIGGWTEAMYITTQLGYDPENPDPEVVQIIAGQKYSLNSLLSFIKNYYDDPVIIYYSKKLKYLNNYFDSFNIYYKKGDIEIDTARKVILTSGSEMNVTVETLNDIRDYIQKMRKEMTE